MASHAADVIQRRLSNVAQQTSSLKAAQQAEEHEYAVSQLQQDFKLLERDLEELEIIAEEQDTEQQRLEVFASVTSLRKQTSHARAAFREAALISKRRVDSLGLASKRAELLRSSTSKPAQSNWDDSSDDALMNATSQVTDSLRRTMQIMQQELDRSVLSNQMLDQSSSALKMTGDQYTTFSGLLDTSKGLITALERADFLDRVLIIAALIFFALVCAFIIKRRIVDRGLRLVGLASYLVPRIPKRFLPGQGAAKVVLESGSVAAATITSMATAPTLPGLAISSPVSLETLASSLVDPTPSSSPTLVEGIELSLTPTATFAATLIEATAPAEAEAEEPVLEAWPKETETALEQKSIVQDEAPPDPEAIDATASEAEPLPEAELLSEATQDAPAVIGISAPTTATPDDEPVLPETLLPLPTEDALATALPLEASPTPEPTATSEPMAAFETETPFTAPFSNAAVDEALESAIHAAWKPVFGKPAHEEMQDENVEGMLAGEDADQGGLFGEERVDDGSELDVFDEALDALEVDQETEDDVLIAPDEAPKETQPADNAEEVVDVQDPVIELDKEDLPDLQEASTETLDDVEKDRLSFDSWHNSDYAPTEATPEEPVPAQEDLPVPLATAAVAASRDEEIAPEPQAAQAAEPFGALLPDTADVQSMAEDIVLGDEPDDGDSHDWAEIQEGHAHDEL